MSNLRTYARLSRKRSRKDKGSQSRADSPAHDTDTEPEEVIVASATARPTRALGPQPTPQRNIQPLQAMPDDARERAESASLIGARCAFTHVAATKGDDIHDKSKVQPMHVVKRASDELTVCSAPSSRHSPNSNHHVDSVIGVHSGHDTRLYLCRFFVEPVLW